MDIEKIHTSKVMRGRGRGRGRAARGRRGGITRGRTKKNVIESDEEEMVQQEQQPPSETQDENFPPTKIDLEADISQLEPPTFTTLNRGPPEPMLHLTWDHKVSLIGEKVLNPMIHCCDKCLKPILIYGRMIPCKHVFCVGCAQREEKSCPRCLEPVSRVEQTTLGTVFMCTHGGSRYGTTGCRRTYLSQRDLQAHINHRHSVVGGEGSPKVQATHPTPARAVPPNPPQADPRSEVSQVNYRGQSRTNTNLITVPIQQELPPPAPPPTTQPPPYHPQGTGGTGYPGVGGTNQYPSGGYSSGYYTTPPPTYPPPPQYPPPPPPPPHDQQPPHQYWQPPPLHQFYR